VCAGERLYKIIRILFVDETLLVIDKPAGLHTLPDGYDPGLPHVRGLLEPQYGQLWIVHRLDRETSGVLVLARSAEAHRALNTQFEQHLVHKVYHARVMGIPAWKEKTVDLPLRTNAGHRHRTIVDAQHGKPAVTHLRVLERFEASALVEASPETGRTHQIRAHLAALGHPIVGDALYGGGVSPTGLFLHARSLQVTHPLSGGRLKFTAEYPQEKDFRADLLLPK
jgi:RluA family pseudouridine synthase